MRQDQDFDAALQRRLSSDASNNTMEDDESSGPAPESDPEPETREATERSATPVVVESLVSGRQRRSNAGNRLQSLLNQEADKEDTLFLEDEDDFEFEVKDKDDIEDYLIESSESEDEDAAAAKDDDGEKEIQAAENEERRARKRKAHETFMKPQRVTAPVKRVAIRDARTTETTTPTEEYTALTRPRKKSERVSWVPDFTATRASNRTLSLQNRSDTMRKLEESEKRRLHTIALMEKAAAKKNKQNPKRAMTQEERLAEAKITEEKNLKSLNRWEEEEKARLDEQRRKLAALQNRKLEGPVITFWSGRAEWDAKNGDLLRVGKGLVEVIEDQAEDAENAKQNERAGSKKGDEAPQQPGESPSNGSHTPPRQSTTPRQHLPFTPPPWTDATPLVSDRSDISPHTNGILDHATLPGLSSAASITQSTPARDNTSQPMHRATPAPTPAQEPEPEPEVEPEAEPEVSTRNLILLEAFDPEAVRTAQGVMKILFPGESRRPWRECYLLSLFACPLNLPRGWTGITSGPGSAGAYLPVHVPCCRIAYRGGHAAVL